MNTNVFSKHMMDLIVSIHECEANRRTLPCLTLLYAGMDVMASLDSAQGEAVQTIFVRWVETFLLPGQSFECSSLDLFAARCGVLHTFTPESRLYRDGKARRIQYAWGNADVAKLSQASKVLGYDIASVHLSDLVAAFVSAVAENMEMLDRDAAKRQRFEAMTGLWFGHVSVERMDEFIESVERHGKGLPV